MRKIVVVNTIHIISLCHIDCLYLLRELKDVVELAEE